MQRVLEVFLQPDTRLLLEDLHGSTGARFRRLNESIAQLIDDWSMISYTPLDYSDEESIGYLLSQVSRSHLMQTAHADSTAGLVGMHGMPLKAYSNLCPV